MKYTSLFLAYLLISLISIGQSNVVVSGTIIDNNQQPVSSGDAFILSKADSSIIKYTPVKEGVFLFDPVQTGDYLLKVSCLGFEENIREISLPETREIAITISKNPSTLAAVTVTASKKTFSYDNGNIKINIENSVFSTIPDPVDLLSKLPTIQVDEAGQSISIIGKGEPLLYIDNQKVTINELSSLSVNDIKTVEIINNPSAKYEANGRSVILIGRKLNKKEGLKVDLSETATQKKFYNNRASAGVSIKKKKIELKTNFQYNQIKNWEGNDYDFHINRQAIESGYKVTSITQRPQFILGAGLLYQINDLSYFSVNTTARLQKNEHFHINTTSFLKERGIQNTVVTNNGNEEDRSYTTTALNYNYFLKKIKGQFFIGSQYSTYNQQLSSTILNNYNNTQEDYSQDRYQENKISVFTSRIDFEKTFPNTMKLEIGSSFSSPVSNAILNIHNYDPANTILSNYNYSEKGYAAYTQLSGELKKINYSVGLRMEKNKVQGGYHDSASLLVDKKSVQLFPKWNLDIPIDSNKSLRLSYAKTIVRPDYSTLSKTTTFINPFFEWASNINIAPSITDEISANFQYKDYSLNISYSRQNGPIYADFTYDTTATRLTRMDRNYQLESGISFNLTIPIKYMAWSSATSIFYGINKVKDPLAYVSRSKPYLYAYSNSQFKLPWDFVFSITGWGVTEQYTGVFERNASFYFDSSISKIFYKKLNCTFSVNNIFKSMPYKESFTIKDIASNGKFYDLRDFSLAIKYTFGKIKESNYKTRDVDESSGRLN